MTGDRGRDKYRRCVLLFLFSFKVYEEEGKGKENGLG